jgi:F-type H+-transporting ATPase subunit b
MDINLTLIMQAVAFAAFIWFCKKFVWPPLMGAIATRQKQIADGLAAGEAGRQNLASAERRIADMLAEAKTRSSEIIAQGEKLKAETIEAAKGEARTDAERIIARPRRRSSRKSRRRANRCAIRSPSSRSPARRRSCSAKVDAKAHADLLEAIRKEL